MTIDSLDTLSALIEEKLDAAQRNGLDRDDVADRLEEHAHAVRNGYVEIPDHRGEWWHDVHADDGDDADGSVHTAVASDD